GPAGIPTDAGERDGCSTREVQRDGAAEPLTRTAGSRPIGKPVVDVLELAVVFSASHGVGQIARHSKLVVKEGVICHAVLKTEGLCQRLAHGLGHVNVSDSAGRKNNVTD